MHTSHFDTQDFFTNVLFFSELIGFIPIISNFIGSALLLSTNILYPMVCYEMDIVNKHTGEETK